MPSSDVYNLEDDTLQQPAEDIVGGPTGTERSGEVISWEEIHNEVKGCNREGLRLLMDQSDSQHVYSILARAEELLGRAAGPGVEGVDRKALGTAQAITASNFGIYYKRMRNYEMAMSYLQRALKTYETVGTDLRTLVAAHLNLCVCLLEAEVPDAAMRHATTAIELKSRFIAAAELGELGEDGQPLATQPDDYATLAIAYHKAAECREALRQWSDATFAYTQAHEVVIRSLGPNHRLTKAFEQSTRCPHRSAPPKLPLTMQPGTPGRSRTVPEGRQASKLPATLPSSASIEFGKYKLDEAAFPRWPPKSATKEERDWYGMARQERGRLRASAAALVRK